MARAPATPACVRCGSPAPGPTAWCCAACGGPFELPPLDLDPGVLDPRASGLWRYRAWLPLAGDPVSLGEPETPLVAVAWDEARTLMKVEGLLPTGSFKDRGTAAMVTHLRRVGARHVVEDSSGNAGASVAGYCARAGIACAIYVPEIASPAKLRQVEAYGARLVRVPGSREATAEAARRAAAQTAYASHVWSPYFLAGTRTCAFELWEQLDRRAPDHVVLPVGSGTLLLGLARGFDALRAAGLVAGVPRLWAVQAASVAPLVRALGGEPVVPPPEGWTAPVAEGIAIARPVREQEILAALRASRGGAVAVDDASVLAAQAELARQGLYAEPTSAAAPAGLRTLLAAGRIGRQEQTVVVLTGHGLKTPPRH